MKVTEVKVSAGRTFNHPFESYSNLRCDVHLQAVLEDGEDPKAATQQLQAQAEEAAETHKQSLLSNLHKLQEITEQNREITELERRMEQAGERLKSLRKSVAAYQGGPLTLSSSPTSDEPDVGCGPGGSDQGGA